MKLYPTLDAINTPGGDEMATAKKKAAPKATKKKAAPKKKK